MESVTLPFPGGPLVVAFVGLFVAMDVIGVVPIYLGMTKGLSHKERSRLVKQSIIVAYLVALVFLILGDVVFRLLGITLPDFKVGGGIVLLVMSILELVKARGEDGHGMSTGAVPLGVPLITGPALITFVMLQVGIYGHAVVWVAMTLNFAIAWLTLENSAVITRVLGKSGADVVSKIMALFTTAIACALVRSGIIEAWRLTATP